MTEDKLKEIEGILNRMVNNYTYGYEYMKNCRDLLEKLTSYNSMIKVTLEKHD